MSIASFSEYKNKAKKGERRKNKGGKKGGKKEGEECHKIMLLW